MPPPLGYWVSDDARLTSVCLLRTSGLSREQRGLGRPKIGTEVAHVTRDSDTTFKVKGHATCRGRGHIVAASGIACCRITNDDNDSDICLFVKFM